MTGRAQLCGSAVLQSLDASNGANYDCWNYGAKSTGYDWLLNATIPGSTLQNLCNIPGRCMRLTRRKVPFGSNRLQAA